MLRCFEGVGGSIRDVLIVDIYMNNIHNAQTINLNSQFFKVRIL
jgi:hypothetical protein